MPLLYIAHCPGCGTRFGANSYVARCDDCGGEVEIEFRDQYAHGGNRGVESPHYRMNENLSARRTA